MGKAGMPCKKYKAESETGTAGGTEKRKSAGGGKECGCCKDQYQDGKENHRTSPYFKRIWGEEPDQGSGLYCSERPEAWHYRTERLRKVHTAENDGGADCSG